MNEKTRPDRASRLRAVLRQGDPAAGEPGLTPEEVQRMRRAVLTAAPERRRAFGVPALVTAAAVLVALALALAFWRAQSGPQAPRREPERQAAVATERALPPVPVPAPPQRPVKPPEPVETPRTAIADSAPVRSVSRPKTPPMRPAPAPEPVVERLASAPEIAGFQPPAGAPEPEELRPRQVQFSTPGGTRVIWMLSTDSVL